MKPSNSRKYLYLFSQFHPLKTMVAEEARMMDLRIQPKSPEVEKKVAAKYNAIADVGDRAFAILSDLKLI